MTRLALFLFACGASAEVAMIGVGGEGAGYWPRWRGPTGQGVVAGGGYPDAWSDTLNVLWKVAVPGRGHSSPIVWGDRIFLTSGYADGPRRSVLCFRRSDGKLLWETFAPEAPGERLYSKNSHASGTPSTDGERVYAYFGNAGLVAVDFAGKIVWHRDLGRVTLYHGSAGSPLLYKDRIILYQDQREGSYIAAVDKKTGAVIWKTPREEQIGWSSAVAVRAGTRDEIVVNSQNRVTAYDPAAGKLLWWVNGTTMEVTPTPAVGAGLVFSASGRAGPTFAIRPGGSGDVTATHVAWQTPRGSPLIPSPLVFNGYLYTVNDMNAIGTCFEASTGKVMWQERLGEPAGHSFSASPIAVDGKVFLFNDSGETFVLDAGPKFQLRRVNKLNEQMLATPALVDGKWYFRTEKHLLAVGK